MTKRLVAKIGDVFCIRINDETKGYFQYIAKDARQLGSAVIKVFKGKFPIDQDVRISEIVSMETAFFVHVFLKQGQVFNIWDKIGKGPIINANEVDKLYFGTTWGMELKQIRPSEYPKSLFNPDYELVKDDPLRHWEIWHVNGERISVGILPEELYDITELGSVFPANLIPIRMERGYYTITHDMYKIVKRIPLPDYHSYTKRMINEQTIYYHFIGENLERQIVVDPNCSTKFLSKNDQSVPELKFHEICWVFFDFISEEEFLAEWNKQD